MDKRKAKQILDEIVKDSQDTLDKAGIGVKTDKFADAVAEFGLTDFQAEGLFRLYLSTSAKSFSETREMYQNEVDTFKQEYDQESREASQQAELENKKQGLGSNPGLELSKEEASAMIDKITSDPNHAYMDSKASPQEHQRAVALVNRLWEIKNGQAKSLEGYQEQLDQERREQQIAIDGYDPLAERSSSNEEEVNKTSEGSGQGFTNSKTAIDALKPHPEMPKIEGSYDNEGNFTEKGESDRPDRVTIPVDENGYPIKEENSWEDDSEDDGDDWEDD